MVPSACRVAGDVAASPRHWSRRRDRPVWPVCRALRTSGRDLIRKLFLARKLVPALAGKCSVFGKVSALVTHSGLADREPRDRVRNHKRLQTTSGGGDP